MAKPTTNYQLPTTGRLRVAIVCDWLVGIGGAERVVLELHKIFPDAPIYTSQYDPAKIDWFKDANVRTTWLQHLPKALRKFLPVLRAWTFSRLDLDDYDLVISATGAEAKFIKTKGDTTHVCYCNAPTHYYWSRYDEYMEHPGFGHLNWLARLGLRSLAGPMRRWDYRAAQRPDYIIGISSHIQKEIKKYYGRDAAVIHPPVNTNFFRAGKPSRRENFVVAGRQTPYKRIDLAVAACTKLGLPLTVIGNGPDHAKLLKMAGPTITFMTNAPDSEMRRHFQTAEAFIFPGKDDFGIVPVEAMATGTPVIAYKAGGALDYVIPGKTGLFFEDQTVESLTEALNKFKSDDFNRLQIRNNAERFSTTHFRAKFEAFIKDSFS